MFLIKFVRIAGARWPSGRVSDSGARGRGFDAYLRRVVSLSKDTYTPMKVLLIPRKRWLRPDMTEKLLTGPLNINTNKQTMCDLGYDMKPMLTANSTWKSFLLDE